MTTEVGPTAGIWQTRSIGRTWDVYNKLLRLLPQDECARIIAVGDKVQLQPRQVLHHYKLPMEHVYFLETGLVSVAAKVAAEKFVEVWLVGSEGLVGAPIGLTGDTKPLHRRIVQIEGTAWRIRVETFRELLQELSVLQAVINRYLAVILLQTSQSGACNANHSMKQRLIRWLLLARSAVQSDEIDLTHEMLANLLGVRRASVTECLEILQDDGLVTTGRRVIKLMDVTGLEANCCDCFRLIEREYQRQLRPLANGRDEDPREIAEETRADCFPCLRSV